MHYFLDPAFDPKKGMLNPEESHHALRALRLKPGDAIEVGDGRGNRYHCRIETTGRAGLTLEIISATFSEKLAPIIRLCIAPVKHPARLEWFLEKATEIGVDEILPIRTSRTEKGNLNTERMMRIVTAAAKQSQRPWLPELLPYTTLDEALQSESEIKLLAHCMDAPASIPLRDALPAKTPRSITVFIGPEGDFTPDEAARAVAAGCTGIDLGPMRLRTETAGIFCVSLCAGLYR